MGSYRMRPLDTEIFHNAFDFTNCVIAVFVVHSFLLLNSVLLYGWIMICLSIHPLKLFRLFLDFF